MIKVGDWVRCLDSVPFHGQYPWFTVSRIYMCEWEGVEKAECHGLGQTYRFVLDNLTTKG